MVLGHDVLSPAIARRYSHLVFHKLSPEDLSRLHEENAMNAPYLRSDVDDDDPPDTDGEFRLDLTTTRAADVFA